MNVHIFAGLGTRAQFTFESPLLEDGGHHLSREKYLLFRPIESRNVFSGELFRHITIQTYPFVTGGNVSLQIGGYDGVVQLIENSGLKNCPIPRRTRMAASFRTGGLRALVDGWTHE